MAIWKTLKSKQTYKDALARIDALIDTERTEATQNELTLLAYLVAEYEAENKAIPIASPLEVIRFMMEMKGIQQKDLIPVLGTKGYVSKILSGAANIQLEKVGALSKLLGIPVEALIPSGDEGLAVISEYAGPTARPTSKRSPVYARKSSRRQSVHEESQSYSASASKSGRKKVKK